MDTQEVIESWPGVMVAMGLGSPTSRGITAACVTGAVCYAAKFPRSAFRRDGGMRPHTSLSAAPDATSKHFLLTPLAVGIAVALFT